MAEVVKRVPLKEPVIIKWVGILDWTKLYRTMQRWFYDNGYWFEEPTYKRKPPTASGYEEEIEWRAWNKVSDYLKNWVYVFFHIYDMKDVPVIKDGKKVNLIKARMRIEFFGEIELDWTKRFGTSRFGEMLFVFYNKFVLQEEKVLSLWWDELYYRVYKLHTITKETLEMEAKENAYYDMW